MEIVGFSTINNIYMKMKPQVSQFGKVNQGSQGSQGSHNPDSSWAKARFKFIKQLAISFGKLDLIKVSDPAFPNRNVSLTREPGKFFLPIIFFGGGNWGSSLHPTGRRQTHQGGINSPCD